tara:strand:- start:508 stop:693 length:186 start_codon:yes stop_codon:yes gene_type:complete
MAGWKRRERQKKIGDFRDLPFSRKPPLSRANHVVGRQYIVPEIICQRDIEDFFKKSTFCLE